MALVHKLSPPAKKGLYNSIFTISGSISYSIGPLIAGLFITFGGLPSVAWMMVPGIVGAAWIYRNDRRTGDIEPIKKAAVEKKTGHRKILVDTCRTCRDGLYSAGMCVCLGHHVSVDAAHFMV